MEKRYEATMIMSAVGDAMGYKNGSWEFQMSQNTITKEYERFNGLENIVIDKKNWRLSDDTIMHMATAIAITRPENTDFNSICEQIALAYIRCMEDMGGRAPGRQTMNSVGLMTKGFSSKEPLKWNEIPYANGGGGCGGAMRSMCIGLKYWNESQIDDLIALSIESGRITHNHPVGFLGAMVSALFTSFAIQNVDPKLWGTKLMCEGLPKAKEYLKKTENDTNRKWENYVRGWNYFEDAWKAYLKLRKIPLSLDDALSAEQPTYPEFPETYGYMERMAFYQSVSFDGWGGSSGHDSVIISYDALLGAGSDWKEMVERAIIHAGDNDSTGAIGCAWWGALYGMESVPLNNYDKIEYKPIIVGLSKAIFKSLEIPHDQK
ncbi:hypothetical protein CYY_002773 [Polysphondylium violaceum]|uniref:ADP-ribosylhydrolase ARH1 n=1 Tax=Polysphondylium violaceum TaxID=133409 RepID=A0A8J4PYA3_9MYCE|nr:hypothetical protein CYY_002773 [Polysphondylium violaceum]